MSKLIIESMYYVCIVKFTKNINGINTIYGNVIIGDFAVMILQMMSFFAMLYFAGKKL